MSEKDRIKICEIISNMLDNPDEHEIYPTSKAYSELEAYVEEVRMEAVGWAYAYCCSLLDSGDDPRTHEVPKMLKAAKKDLG